MVFFFRCSLFEVVPERHKQGRATVVVARLGGRARVGGEGVEEGGAWDVRRDAG